MVSRINNNAPSFPPVDELSSEQESAKSTQAESKKSAMITEIGIPDVAGNSPSSPESTSIAADGKNLMNMRAGLLQKSLNGGLSRENTHRDGTTTNVVESLAVKYTVVEKPPGKYILE